MKTLQSQVPWRLGLTYLHVACCVGSGCQHQCCRGYTHTAKAQRQMPTSSKTATLTFTHPTSMQAPRHAPALPSCVPRAARVPGVPAVRLVSYNFFLYHNTLPSAILPCRLLLCCPLRCLLSLTAKALFWQRSCLTKCCSTHTGLCCCQYVHLFVSQHIRQYHHYSNNYKYEPPWHSRCTGRCTT